MDNNKTSTSGGLIESAHTLYKIMNDLLIFCVSYQRKCLKLINDITHIKVWT